jgi:hypothetical protein
MARKGFTRVDELRGMLEHQRLRSLVANDEGETS